MWITMWITDFRRGFDVDNSVENLPTYPQFKNGNCG